MRRFCVLILVVLSMALLAVIGCGGNKTTTSEAEAAADNEQTSDQKTEPSLSASEAQYAEYLKTLTPEQQAVRESLNPDTLARMTDSELADAFTIKINEVADGNGKIDPKKYAEAFAVRVQLMYISGMSEIEYAKYGGLMEVDPSEIKKILERYFNIESIALFGHVGDMSVAEETVGNGVTVNQLIRSYPDEMQKEDYQLRITVVENSVKLVENSTNGKQGKDFNFKLKYKDNLNYNAISSLIGNVIKPVDEVHYVDVFGLRTNNEKLLFNSVELGDDFTTQ